MIAMPATDSASCAVTAEIRFRTSTCAECERTWNQRVSTSAGERADQKAGEQPAAEVDERVDDDDVRQEALVVADDALVDRVADEDPAAGLRGRLARGGEHQDGHPRPAAAEVPRQARETGAVSTRQ